MNDADDTRTTPRPKDPAWVWYTIAAVALAVVLTLELSGALGPLTP